MAALRIGKVTEASVVGVESGERLGNASPSINSVSGYNPAEVAQQQALFFAAKVARDNSGFAR